ncbi:response regulator transcription factor [uncultured Bradyrhizobium sp.]|uniref:response regulator n=1 Tax=uncultured Bradyrhizobium sp. TaxID=199684 RepID=UPI002608A799|nr:response regulator transcription factor [uncultured Bradyrhizobium sp.]
MKVLVVDDHSIVRDGLAALLEQVSPEFEVFQAGDAEEGLQLLDQVGDFDLVILDLFIPGVDGFEAISAFGLKRPELPVIVLSSSEDSDDVRRALASGALGYVPKSASQHVLLSAIKLVMNGDLYVPPLVLSKSSDSNSQTGDLPKANGKLLTPRQREVLILLCEGNPNKAIATKLNLSEKTVKTHISLIYKALNVANRMQASKAAREAGLI